MRALSRWIVVLFAVLLFVPAWADTVVVEEDGAKVKVTADGVEIEEDGARVKVKKKRVRIKKKKGDTRVRTSGGRTVVDDGAGNRVEVGARGVKIKAAGGNSVVGIVVPENEGVAGSASCNGGQNCSMRCPDGDCDLNETCFTCHPKQRHEFRKRSHMPLLEGKIACSDCHQPHGSSTASLLRADSVNQLCNSCHAEKRGPFLWEHAPVVESCLNCHHPHGSNHEELLLAPVPFLCNRCHGQIASFSHPNDLLVRGNLADGALPDERILNRGCVNCHAQIHGSNHPSGPRLHR